MSLITILNGIFESSNSDRKSIKFSDMVLNVSGNLISINAENPISKGDGITYLMKPPGRILQGRRRGREFLLINDPTFHKHLIPRQSPRQPKKVPSLRQPPLAGAHRAAGGTGLPRRQKSAGMAGAGG